MKDISATKEKILNAAIDEFGKKGLKFTMDDIAKNLNMSKKTLYGIYESKEEMLLEIVDSCFADIKKNEKAIVDDPKLDTLTKIRKIMVVLPERYTNKGLSNLYLLKDKFPVIYERVAEYLSGDWDATIQLVEQGIREGVVREVSIPVMQVMAESTFQKFMGDSVLVDNNLTYEQALDEMVEIIINGIKA